MVENTAIERIIDNLAFEVEALPQDNVLEISGTSKATPLNVKIKVRKKNEAPFKHGIVSVPKVGHPKKRPEQIRLINSDQTVMSFDIFVDTEPDNKPTKKRKRFFGGCLSTEDNEDEPYVDTNRVTVARSSNIVTQNFGLSKTENVQDMQLQPRKPVMFLGNRCKPGGCLDPPLDEEIYSYEPKELKKETVEETLKSTLKEGHKTSKIESNKEEIESDNKSLESVYQADFIKSLSDAQYLDSIITYPTNEIADDIVDRPSNTNSRSGESRNTFSEFRESFFIPPKNASIGRNNSNAFKGLPLQNFESHIGERRSSDDKIFTKVSSEENTKQNLKIINDSIIINNKDFQSKNSTPETSSLGIDTNKQKNSKDLQYAKENNVTTARLQTRGLSNDSNKVQTKEYLELTKEDIVITTVLKTGAVLVTPLIAATAMSKIKSDEDSGEIPSGYENDDNDVNTECDPLNNDLEEKSDERSSKDKNTFQNNKADDFSYQIDEGLKSNSNDFNNIFKEDLQSSDSILSTDDDDNFSKEYINQTDNATKDEIFDMLTINDNYSTKDIAAESDSQIYSGTEENRDMTSQIINNMEEDKSAQESSFKKENLDIVRISGNEDNNKEQYYSTSKEQLNSLNIRASAAEEERRRSRLSSNEDNIKKQHYSTSEQLSSLNIRALAAEEERRQLRLSGNEDNIKEQQYSTSKEERCSMDILAPAANVKRLTGNKDSIIKERHYSSSKEELNSLDIPGPAVEEEKRKLRLSGNEDNTKEQRYSTSKEQLATLDFPTPTAEEKRRKLRLSSTSNEDNIKEQQYSYSKEQLSSLDFPLPAAEEERRRLRLSFNEDNIKEQQYSYSKEQLSSLNIRAPEADEEWLPDNKDSIREQQYSTSKEQLSSFDILAPAEEERRKLFDTGVMVESQDATEEEYKKFLISGPSYNEIINDARKPNITESNTYQDTVLSVETIERTQMNLDNNTYNNKDKVGQRNAEDELKDNQKASTVNIKVHDMINDSVIQKQYDGENYSVNPTGHDVITQQLEKLDNGENRYKSTKKYNEFYKQSSPDNNLIYMDIAFHSFINDKNENVIKTLDTFKHIKRQPQDKVTVIKSEIPLNVPRVIEIPIDNHKNITLEIKANDYQKPSLIKARKPDTWKCDNDNKKHTKSQRSQASTAEIEWFQDHLTAIYENQLLPLQTLITDLKKDVDILAAQQMWLKEIVSKSRKPKTLKLTLSNRKCVCFKK